MSQLNQSPLELWLLAIKKRDISKVVIVRNPSVKRNTASVSSKELIALISASVKNVRTMKLASPALLSRCLKFKKKLSFRMLQFYSQAKILTKRPPVHFTIIRNQN